MQLGLFMDTHGVGAMIDGQWTLQPIPASRMDVKRTAPRAEAAGFDSLWFSDHVLMTPSPESLHMAADPVDGARAYPTDPDILDALSCIAAAAMVTERIRLAPSVWIPSYRHPLHDARQMTTIDHLADGRLVVGVGAGWMKEEFAALGVPYDERISRTEEAVAVYRKAWSDDVVDHEGEHFSFSGIRMDPKPVQIGGPRVYYGGVSRRGAQIAAGCCDGFYPTFTDGRATADRYRSTVDALPGMLSHVGRRSEDFSLLAVLSARVDDDPAQPGLGKGPAAKVLDDLALLADEGFSLVVLHLDTVTGDPDEWLRQLDLFGEHVVGPAAGIASSGPWRPA